VTGRNIQLEQWLTEAEQALAEAERLTGLLALALMGPRQDLALATLQAQIMVLRQEVERLQRRGGVERREFHPDWSGNSAWCQPRP
jgi:hypothetical protein